jgi:hypothetical protein
MAQLFASAQKAAAVFTAVVQSCASFSLLNKQANA